MDRPPLSTPRLDNLLGPADLRQCDATELSALAEEIRTVLRTTISQTGGHLSSNLGVVELTLALHRVFDFGSDRLLFDVGHQAYVHKLLTGRFQAFGTLRCRGGVAGFPDPEESPYDIVRVGHSSTAISTGVGLAEAYRRLGQHRKTVVVVGDGALTGGMSFEGIINAGVSRSDLLVVLNDNGNFIDEPVGALHRYFDRLRSDRYYITIKDRILRMLKHLPFGLSVERLATSAESAARRLVSAGSLFEDLGFRYFGPVSGHDRPGLETILRRVGEMRRPVLLHVQTEKGGGWQPSADDPRLFHGPRGFDPDTGFFHPRPPQRETWSEVFGTALLELAEEDPKLVAVTAAMPTGTGLTRLAERFPDRMIDVGLCEQHSIGFVEGLAVAGLHPVVAHYSTFAQRAFDQVFQELALQHRLGVLMTLDRAGLVGEDGETHQGIYDIAWCACLPGAVLLSPKDGPELKAMMRWCQEQRDGDPAPLYVIRYPKETIPDHTWGLERPAPIVHGRAEIIRRGAGPLMIWSYGPMLWRVWDALQALGEVGRRVTLVNARFAKPLDADLLTTLAVDHDQVLTVEDHVLPGGFGSLMGGAIADLGLALQLHRAGIRDAFIPHATREEQLADHGLDVAGLRRRIEGILGDEVKVIPLARRG